MDWHDLAELELSETPHARESSLKELQVLLREAGIKYPIMDDNRFLLRFLRVDKFNVPAAFQRIQKYYKIREKMVPRECGPRDYKHIYSGLTTTVLARRDAERRKVFISRVGHWNADSGFTLEDLYVPDIFLLEQALDDDESQVRGLVAIVDMSGFSFWHLRQFSFSHIKVLVHTVQDAFPARFKAIHVVHQPGLYDYIYACIRPFLKPKIVKRIHLHGSDMKSLHEHVDPEILPEEYGGQAGPFSNDWICQQLYQRDEEFRRYSHYGFARDGK